MNNSMNNGAANNNSNNEGGKIIMTSGTIRTMEVFAGTVKSVIEATYGSEYSVTIKSVMKNNGIHLTGLTIHREGINITPTIYLETFFEEYQEGASIEAVCREIISIYDKNKAAKAFDSTVITDFGQAKDRICFRLVNAEKNRELLADIPYIPYHDLAITFYILIAKNPGGTGTVLVRNNILDMWKINTQVLYTIALENTQRIFRGSVQSMESVMIELLGDWMDVQDSKEFYDMPAVEENAFPMYVASNHDRLNGASVLLYPNLLRDFAERIGCDFYILPSSVHELVFVPESAGMDAGELKMMVEEINGSEVADNDVLSDNVYFYSRAYDRVEMM